MKDLDSKPDEGDDRADETYEAPVVEDIDTARGPAVTAAGGTAMNVSSPRNV